MAVIRESLNISFVKLIVVGEPRVGKTSLIRTMKEGQFREQWDNWGEDLVRKIIYWPDEKISLQMGELQLDELTELPEWAQEAKGVLLLYDNDDKETLDGVRNKWYHLVNRHFAHVPLWLIRAKTDEPSGSMRREGPKLRQALHATGFFYCSAKKMEGVDETFTEVLKSLRLQEMKKTTDVANDPLNAASSMACFGIMLTKSGPLFRQGFSNLYECIRNPQAFTRQKKTIEGYLPFVNFGLPKDYEEEKKT